MNAAAQAHLAKAKEYVSQGEQYYSMAAEQIIAARNEGATWAECGDALGRSDKWCSRIVTWHESPGNSGTGPFWRLAVSMSSRARTPCWSPKDRISK
jgi:hypothetical protein